MLCSTPVSRSDERTQQKAEQRFQADPRSDAATPELVVQQNMF